jgi:hypothetical protein
MKDNIEKKDIGNRKIIIELRFEHNVLIVDKKGELINALKKADVIKPFNWDMGVANFSIWDGDKKEEAYNALSVQLNRLNFVSRQIDSVDDYFSKFNKMYKSIIDILGKLEISRIGCRILGTYKVGIDNYDDVLATMKKIIPVNFLLSSYPTTDYRFELIYKSGMYNIGPINKTNDNFVMQNFTYPDMANHVGIGIDTDNYLTNELESINDEKLIHDVYVASLSVEKDLYNNICTLFHEK